MMQLLPTVRDAIAKWHEMMARRDFASLESIVAPDAVFRSPVAHSPYHGRDATCLVLRAAAAVFEDFTYHREFTAGQFDVALEFAARIGDKKLKGVDLLRFDDAGLIREFEVMVRPATGLMALGEAMRCQLGADAGRLTGSS